MAMQFFYTFLILFFAVFIVINVWFGRGASTACTLILGAVGIVSVFGIVISAIAAVWGF